MTRLSQLFESGVDLKAAEYDRIQSDLDKATENRLNMEVGHKLPDGRVDDGLRTDQTYREALAIERKCFRASQQFAMANKEWLRQRSFAKRAAWQKKAP